MRVLAGTAARGDAHALTTLLAAVAPAMFRAVRLVLGGAHPDAEDVVQQALIAFLQALPTFRGECHPAGFASRIAVHTALTHRRQCRQRQVCQGDLATLMLVEEQDVSANGNYELATDRMRFLRTLLDELPPEQAEIIALSAIVGHSLREIADATACPLNTVKSRLRLAKEALRRRLADEPWLDESAR